jgi:hypothetical protein
MKKQEKIYLDPITKSYKLNKQELEKMRSFINDDIYNEQIIKNEIEIINDIDDEMLMHYNIIKYY